MYSQNNQKSNFKKRDDFKRFNSKSKITKFATKTRAAVKTIRARAPGLLDFNLITEDLTKTIQNSLRQPAVLVVLLLCTALIFTHSAKFETGVIGQWTKANSKNALSIWITANKDKFLGLLAFAPSLYASPKNVRIPLLLGTVLWVTTIPESSILQYFLQSLALFLYFKVQRPNTRVFVVFGAAAAYYFGWFAYVKPTLGSIRDSASQDTVTEATP